MVLQKVSVVVPIYKVEQYLKRCVDSIVNQTYPNLEIILVNDGSPDQCGEMIEQYAEKDQRIIALHKENGGLSDARNYGMTYVTGDFTLFVDSDDWIEKTIIKEMVDTNLKYQADVIQSAFYYAYEDHLLFDNRYYSQEDPPVVLNNEQLMKELVINERVKNFAWGKLFRTELIKKIPFKKGVLFEDVFWAHQVMHSVRKYVILNKPKFYYFQRNDSIVATYTPRNLDFLRGLKKRHLFLKEHYQDLIDESLKVLIKAHLIHYNLLLQNYQKDRGGFHRKEIQSYIKENYSELRKAVKNEPQIRKQLQLFVIHPYLNIGFLAVKKILRKLLILEQPLSLQRINVREINNGKV